MVCLVGVAWLFGLVYLGIFAWLWGYCYLFRCIRVYVVNCYCFVFGFIWVYFARFGFTVFLFGFIGLFGFTLLGLGSLGFVWVFGVYLAGLGLLGCLWVNLGLPGCFG